jgi:cell division ATPase FtsA
MLPILTDILKETAEAIKYYEETFKQKLDDIYLLGGSSLLPDVITTIKSNLGREVRPVSNSNNINLNFLANKEKNFPLFASVVGLGMVGASGEFQDINLLKKMPKGEINSIDKLNLFKLGYLSPVNTVRTIINNKYVLVTLIILIGIIFAILLRQVKNYGL